MDTLLCLRRKSRPADPLSREKKLLPDDDDDDESEYSLLKPAQKAPAGFFSALCVWFSEPIALWNHRKDEEIEQMRRKIDDHRRRWGHIMLSWESTVDFAHLRQQAWAEGTDVEGWERHAHFSFDLEHRYAVQTSKHARDCLDAPHVLDFRTPEGRGAAVAWFEHGAARQRSARRGWDALYDRWGRVYEKWLQEDNRYRRERARKQLLSCVGIPTTKNTIGFKQLPD